MHACHDCSARSLLPLLRIALYSLVKKAIQERKKRKKARKEDEKRENCLEFENVNCIVSSNSLSSFGLRKNTNRAQGVSQAIHPKKN
jgi:hypothetical protein